MPVYHCRRAQLQFRSGFWSTFTGSTVRGGRRCREGPSSIDVLVEVTPALLARISSKNSLWQIVAWTEISTIWGLQNARKNGEQDTPNVVTLMTDLDR
jgi:hypothetical protein